MAEHSRQADTAPPTITPDSGLEPFTFALPQWMRRIRDRNPLVRSNDRIEALALAAMAIIAVLAVPVAGLVGTASYENVAAGQAVVTASVWAGIVAVAAAAYLALRAWCRHTSSRRWQQGFDDLVETLSP